MSARIADGHVARRSDVTNPLIGKCLVDRSGLSVHSVHLGPARHWVAPWAGRRFAISPHRFAQKLQGRFAVSGL